MKSNIAKTSTSNKKSFSLFEIIIVIVLLSIIYYTVIVLLGNISYTNKKEYEKTIHKLEVENTYLYLNRKYNNDKNLSNITLIDDKLLYKNNLLLKNVISFQLKMYNTKHGYSICIQNNIIFCEEYILE